MFLFRMITVEHLYKSFEDREVLKDINAEFRDGEVNLIIADFHDDFATLRRDLVDECFMRREGGQYRRMAQ